MDDDLSSSGSEKDESSNSTKEEEEEEKEIKNSKTETLEIPSVIPSTTEKKIEGHSLTIENKEKESWFILFGRLNFFI